MQILFVCTGNTCRSPMAEGLFNARAARRGLSHRASSCGTAALSGRSATELAVGAVKKYGADIGGHVSQPLSETLLVRADKVYCMTPAHADAVASAYPAHAEKVEALSSPVPDPFGGDEGDYAAAAAAISAAVDAILDSLEGEKP